MGATGEAVTAPHGTREGRGSVSILNTAILLKASNKAIPMGVSSVAAVDYKPLD